MLDDRKAAILNAVVQEYVATAQPVGSAHVARHPDVNVSSATVRNDMAVLERDGYLAQPHTSAGRIPTDKGYRFFVDRIQQPGVLAPTDGELVRNFFARAHGELEQMLHDTGRLLTQLTDYAAVVVAPPAEHAVVRSVQLVGLAPRQALLVIVLSNGAVEKHSLELVDDTPDERLSAATKHLAAAMYGKPVGGVDSIASTGDPATDVVIGTAYRALVGETNGDTDHVFVGGASRMAAAFDAVDTVRQVLVTLEEQFIVVSLLRDLLDRGLSVAIGTEHGLEPLATCSIVVAPYETEGQRAGSIAVLGPTRMDYQRALATVAVVSQRLGRYLETG